MEELSLKTLLDNYTSNLCKKCFVLTLSNQNVIKIRFFVESFCHLLGLQHVYDHNRNYLGQKGYNKISNGLITISDLKKHNKNKYNFIKNRIIHFDEIIDVLKYGELVKFTRERVKNGTNIVADFVLYKDEQKYLLQLFLVKERNTDIYTPISFFTVSEDDKNKYITTNRPIGIIAREEIVI